VKVAIGVAVVASVAGLYVSFYFNVASGASIVLVETLLFAIALLFSPKSGWLLRRARPTTSALIVGPAQDT
jgi:ABC-type Mn2+/Zn2+ transport system permease subunit